jgi:AraC-like DNA-binding protein
MEGIFFRTEARLEAPNVKAAFRTFLPNAPEDIWRPSGYVICHMPAPQNLAYARSHRGGRVVAPLGSYSITTPRLSVGFSPLVQPSRVFVVRMTAAHFENVTALQDWRGEELPYYLDLKSDFMRAAIRRLEQETREPGLASESILETVSHAVLLDLASLLGRRRDEAHAMRGGLAGWQLRRIQDRLAERELPPPSIASLAQECRLSADHLMHAFKRSTGETLYRCIEEARLAQCKSLLLDGELSLKEIAFRMGFASPSHFSTAFRRLAGQTPSSFRREYRVAE